MNCHALPRQSTSYFHIFERRNGFTQNEKAEFLKTFDHFCDLVWFHWVLLDRTAAVFSELFVDWGAVPGCFSTGGKANNEMPTLQAETPSKFGI